MFLLMSWLCLLVSCTHVDAEHECIRFSVPSLTVAENTTKNISFQVLNECSTGLKLNFTFDVERWQGSTAPVCLAVGLKQLNQGECRCVKDGRNLSCNLTATFDRKETKWIFQSGAFDESDRQKVKKEEFSANVTYPPTITSFTLGGQHSIVDTVENTSVQAVCSWNNGNPLRQMLLRNPENQTIHNKGPMPNEGGRLTAVIFDRNATCWDTGLYVCEAEGVDVQESVFLRIQCPPQFLPSDSERNTRFVSAQTEAQFDFKIFSYTNITQCTLAGPRNRTTRDCKQIPGQVSITGSPPNLKLTLVFRNVSEEDSGTWQLSVENGFSRTSSIPEAATVNFILVVTQQTSSNTPTVTTEPPPISPGMYTLIGVVGFLVLVIISLLVFIAVYTKKKRQDRGVIIRTGNADTQGGGPQDRGRGSHFYEEIPEIPRTQRFHHHGQRQIPQPRGSPALPPTPAVDNLPDDYLHPVNNTPSTSGTNQSAVASAAPAGPYESLEMSDVGLRSAYSQLGM